MPNIEAPMSNVERGRFVIHGSAFDIRCSNQSLAFRRLRNLADQPFEEER